MKFAKTTTVPIERSRVEIERILKKYGADQFLYGWKDDRVMLGFRIGGLNYQMRIPLPEDPQGQRQAMRVLLLLLKGKLEFIESEMSTAAHEFMPYLLMANGKTVGDFVLPAIKAGKLLKSLPIPGNDDG